MAPRTRPPADRFFEKVKVNPTTGCWEWIASTNRNGYGQFALITRRGARKMAVAHRWCYEHLVGAIPDGLQLDHLCRVRHCVNPDHLEPVTNRENVLRGYRHAAAVRELVDLGGDDG